MKFAIWHTGLLGLVAAAVLTLSGGTADAAVYCKYVGYPKGCVVRPGVVLAPRPVPPPPVVYCTYIDYPAGCVVRPGVVLAPRPVVYCTYVGYPRGCVARAGVVLRPAPRGMNLGGPVNRPGIR